MRSARDRGRDGSVGILLKLQAVERGVAAAAAQQLLVAAGLDDLARLDHQDAVRVHDGGEPVRDHDGGAALAELGDRLLHVPLGFGIERGGRFIEQDDGRVLDQRARDGDALALAAGELGAVLADRRVVVAREGHDEVMRVRGARGRPDLVLVPVKSCASCPT